MPLPYFSCLPNTMISETLHGYLHQYAAPSRGSRCVGPCSRLHTSSGSCALQALSKWVMRAASSPFRSSCKLLEDGSRISEHARGKNDQHVGNRLICNARLEPIKVGQRPRSGAG